MNNKIAIKRIRAAMACSLVALSAGSAFGQVPILYYNFNETVGSTTLIDGNLDGGDAFNATYRDTENLPTYGPGVLRGAWQGNGGSLDSFLTDEITALNDYIDFTISLWINPSTAPGFDGLFVTREAQTFVQTGAGPVARDSYWGLNQQGNQIDARYTNGALDTPGNSVPTGEWTHLAYTLDSLSGVSTVYLNGAVSATDGPAGNSNALDVQWTTGGVWSVGDDPCCDGREWAGLMDDLAVFDDVLSATEVMDIYQNGQNGIAINGDVNPLPGDVDGDSDVDTDDLDPIVMNFLDTVSGVGVDTRVLGDLTNDGFVGLADFREWKDNFPTNSSIRVPEPGALMLAFLGVTLAIFKSRHRLLRTTSAIALLGLVMQTAEVATAQVVLTIDQDTGSMTATNTSQDDILFDGYEIRSINGLLDSSSWANFETVQGLPGWEILGTADANRLGEGFTSEGTFATFATDPAFDFGTVFDSTALYTAQLAVGFGNEARDASFGYLEPGNSALTQATVEYIGETVTNNLVLKVASDGTAVIENESPFALSIDGFAIQSAGSLNDNWAGSPDLAGPDWLVASADSDAIGQVSPFSQKPLDAAVGGVVQPGGQIDMGDIFVVGSPTDLEFRFLRIGEEDGDGFLGVVEYDPSLVIQPGDYNDNGLVDAADYTIWRDTFGSTSDLTANGDNTGASEGIIDDADYNVWRDNYGAGQLNVAGVALVAVPEPVSASLLLLAVAGGVTSPRR